MNRREFVHQSSFLLAGSLAVPASLVPANAKTRVALVGTGVRGLGMWGKPVLEEFGSLLEFVGLCDSNPGRVETGRKFLGLSCPVYTDFDRMLRETRPDKVLVMTVDGTHHQFIIKALEAGCDVITEKPMTIDEQKIQAILDAETKSGKKVTVTFNYRYSPHRQKIWELLRSGVIGTITSADFHWYLDVHHGADYFRRWHRLRKNSGSLLVHKASHHFDLLNWWLESEPETVTALGNLEFYGKNGPFRSDTCRNCAHQKDCSFYFDITKDKQLMDLYVANEKHDGYHRDGCVFREDIDIFDKMAVQIRYANKVNVSYSLTTYSPYEGYRIAFNGTKGRLEAWIKERQPWEETEGDQLELTTNFGKRTIYKVDANAAGHGGGDVRLRRQVFQPAADTYRQAAGSREGAMACLIGIAARNSIDSGQPIQIASLTSLVPQAVRP